jgi:hypothetical protein
VPQQHESPQAQASPQQQAGPQQSQASLTGFASALAPQQQHEGFGALPFNFDGKSSASDRPPTRASSPSAANPNIIRRFIDTTPSLKT